MPRKGYKPPGGPKHGGKGQADVFAIHCKFPGCNKVEAYHARKRGRPPEYCSTHGTVEKRLSAVANAKPRNVKRTGGWHVGDAKRKTAKRKGK